MNKGTKTHKPVIALPGAVMKPAPVPFMPAGPVDPTRAQFLPKPRQTLALVPPERAGPSREAQEIVPDLE